MSEVKKPWTKSTQTWGAGGTIGLILASSPSPAVIAVALSAIYAGYALGRCLLKVNRPVYQTSGLQTSEFKIGVVLQVIVFGLGFFASKDIIIGCLVSNVVSYMIARGLTKKEKTDVSVAVKTPPPPRFT